MAIIDIYIDVPPRFKIWLIDINPWLSNSVDPLMFTWEELEN